MLGNKVMCVCNRFPIPEQSYCRTVYPSAVLPAVPVQSYYRTIYPSEVLPAIPVRSYCCTLYPSAVLLPIPVAQCTPTSGVSVKEFVTS